MPTIVAPQPTRPMSLLSLSTPPPPMLGSPIELTRRDTESHRATWAPKQRPARRAPRRQLFSSYSRSHCCCVECPIIPSSRPPHFSVTDPLDLPFQPITQEVVLPSAGPGPIRRRKALTRPSPLEPPRNHPYLLDIDIPSSRDQRPITPTRSAPPNSQIQFRNLMPVLLCDIDDESPSPRSPALQ
ncbi:hypothetical protein EYR36_000935 [Pleurotus pulmonarius]|nr:hypothetical protein EYR36_004447 [Pleurotus pulmonarius]KAF4579125.1 hypothetical protein EYR36_000935 [Pleurotus pulmonarius]KAF4603536.1 hypothetical protein EYR38_003949 [Pleurotus pulmonarius]